MILPNRAAIRLTGFLIGMTMHLWLRTLDIRFAVDDLDAAPRRMKRPGLYIFWHEMLTLPAYTHAREIVPVVSRSLDGEFITEVLRQLRAGAIRGSTGRGGTRALREMMRRGRREHLGLAVDGPLGPARVVSDGAIYLAARRRMPIVPIGFAVERALRPGPEGRKVALPWPFTRAWAVAGRPIDVPADLTRLERRTWRARVQEAMDGVQARAERLAGGGTDPAPVLSLREVRDL